MADGLDLGRGEVARASDELALDPPRGGRAASASAAPARPRAPHATKFRAATVLLAGVAIAAVAVAVALAVSGRSHAGSAPWSDWAPPDGGTQGAQEIAERIAPLYRIDATNQLAIVTVINTESPTAAAAAAAGGSSGASSGLAVAVESGASGGQISLLSGNTIAYNLCGMGSGNCSIGVGTPSTARLLLLRREALELALYTFKYISSAQNVVAILPPGHTQPTSTLVAKPPTAGSSAGQAAKPVDVAVLFLRDELAPLLQQPLSSVLPEPVPPTVAQMSAAPEAGLVDQVTARGLFSERIVSQQDGSNLLVLSQLPPQ